MKNEPLPTPPYPWQQSFWHTFVADTEHARLPHAMLLCGAEGIGVEKLGLAMAAYLLCEAPIEGNCCLRCKACQLRGSQTHPDLFALSPEAGSNVIKIDQVRPLVDFAAKTAQQGGRKVVLIDPAERMNINAANALLKCLEEPAGDTVFILISTQSSRLMPTIRSRCRTCTLGIPDSSESVQWLKDMDVLEPELVLDEARGAPVLAHSWSRSAELQVRADMCASLAHVLAGRQTASSLAGHWVEYGAPQGCQLLIAWLEKLIRARTTGEETSPLTSWENLLEVNRRVPEKLLFRLREEYCKRLALLQANANLNTQMVLEELILDWLSVVKLAVKGSVKRRLA